MAEEIEIHNLFGKLALDTTVTISNEKLENIKGLVVALNERIIKSDSDHIKGEVLVVNDAPIDIAVTNSIVPTTGLTNDQLRAEAVEVKVTESILPENATKESTLLQLKQLSEDIKSLVNILTERVHKADTDDSYVNLVGIKENAALRSMGRLSYDTLNNLRVTNAPTGTQTVTISTTGNSVISQDKIGNLDLNSTTVYASRVTMNQTLSRMIFS